MAKINRTCIVCGKKYSYCPSCREDLHKPSWYSIFETENCKKIYDLCVAFNNGHIDVNEAYELLNKCNLNERKNFTESTNLIIDRILDSKKASEVVEKKQDVEPERTNKFESKNNK